MFTSAKELDEFKKIIHKILLDATPKVLTLNETLQRFKATTGKDFRVWFQENHRGIPKAIPLFETHLTDIVRIDTSAPKVLVHGLGEGFPERNKNFNENVQRMSKDDCENNLKKTLTVFQGTSKNNPIEIGGDEYFEFDYTEQHIPETSEFKELHYDASKFKNYRDFQMIHIAYVKLRMIFLYKHVGRSSLHIHTMLALFRQLFNESFFQSTILKHFITSTDDRDQNVVTFLKRFCGDFLHVSDNGRTTVCRSMTSITTKMLQNLVKSVSKIKGLEGPGIPVEQSVNPPHVHYLGNPSEDQQADVRRCPEFTNFSGGPSKPQIPNFLDFPGIEHDANRTIRPSIHEVNDAVNTIRGRLCKEMKAVKIPEICLELCKMYGVTSVRDLRPTQHREIRRESDIPALNEIIKLQGKV